jgi:radical SAM superfamily enzyme YgiQ (UPF0313 family)
VVEEIDWLVCNFEPRKVVFVDETFTLNKKRVLKIADRMMAKGLHKKLTWVAQTRVDRADREIFEKMRAAGCTAIEFGVESGNQQILNGVDKKIKLADAEETVRLARVAKLLTSCSFILGHPYETEETIRDTIDFAVKLRPDSVSFGIMSPYPGTRIWDMARAGEGNYRLLSNNWENYLRFGGGCLELTTLPRKRLEALQVKAYISFYLRTFKILRFLQYGVPRWRQSVAVVRKLLFSNH